MITELTKQQKAKIKTYQKKWSDKFFSLEFDKNKAFRFVELKNNATLTHEEHDTLDIPDGKYQVMLQREVDLLGEVRQVMD